MDKLNRYLKMKNITITDAAHEIGMSREWLHRALRNQPIGQKSAWKIEEWSEGFVSAIDLIGLYREEK